LATGKSAFRFNFAIKNKIYTFITLCIAPSLVYPYHDRGLIGVLLMFCLFIPLQSVTKMHFELQQQEEMLLRDTLTGLYNFSYFKSTIENKHEKQEEYSLLMMDLNRFKDVNDNHGHDIGNVILKQVSVLMKNCLDKDSVVCRYGGDEFCVISNNKETSINIANNIIQTIDKTVFLVDKLEITVGVSIGLYVYPGNHETVATIVSKADKAMYKSKKYCKEKNEVLVQTN
jgi:diguanylate cyclase (GGDEF)-like protein